MDKNIILLDIIETKAANILSVSVKRINVTDRIEVIDDVDFHQKIDSREYLFDLENTLENYFNKIPLDTDVKIFVWYKEKKNIYLLILSSPYTKQKL